MLFLLTPLVFVYWEKPKHEINILPIHFFFIFKQFVNRAKH